MCKKGDNEDLLLLCDGCDKGCHTYCHKPKITSIPEGDWYCPACISKVSEPFITYDFFFMSCFFRFILGLILLLFCKVDGRKARRKRTHCRVYLVHLNRKGTCSLKEISSAAPPLEFYCLLFTFIVCSMDLSH